ncbi:uncharacterized protein LOC128210245 isoform X1 [Mya arenaria]|uniref:uncharacterized protein LOC128210245 isoform X1 n=1 Tax=Mya arenaria TaxID=6604 RepID=UPI0022E22A3E|nr:uncharacterized protein LOC128210245 isoform X1 [Mya arenaria]
MKYRHTVGFAFWTAMLMILPAFGSYADDEIAELINEAEDNRADSGPDYTSLKDLAMLQDSLRSYQTMNEPSEAVFNNDNSIIPGLRDVFMLIASKGLKDVHRRHWPRSRKTELIPDGFSKRFMCNYEGCSGKRSIENENNFQGKLQRFSEGNTENPKYYCTRNRCFYQRRRRSGIQAKTYRDNFNLSSASKENAKQRTKCIGRICRRNQRKHLGDIKDISKLPRSSNYNTINESRCKGLNCIVNARNPSSDINRTPENANLKESMRRKRAVRSCRSFQCLFLGTLSKLRYRAFDNENEHPKYDDRNALDDTYKGTSLEDNHLSQLEKFLFQQINGDPKLIHNRHLSTIVAGPCMKNPTSCTHRVEDKKTISSLD